MTTQQRFNPYAYERPVLDLGDHGAFTVKDLTKSLRAKMDKLDAELEAVDQEDEDAVVAIVTRQIEACLIGGDGKRVGELLAADYANDALGLNALVRTQKYLSECLGLGSVEGND